MPLACDKFDLKTLHLTAGQGRRLDLHVAIEPFMLAGESYPVGAPTVPARVDISRTTGDGYVLRLRVEATLHGPCMRCLAPARPRFQVDAREVFQPGGGEELDSPYLKEGVLDLASWAREALALMLPAKLLCRDDCAGLCPVCGADLNAAGPDHVHEQEPDPRWAKLSEIEFG